MTLDETIELLASAPLFELLGHDALRLMAFAAETRKLRPGEYLFREGERSDGGYVVLSGELVTRKAGSHAEVPARRGDLVGRMALFLRTNRPASALARERTEVLRISLTLMKRALEEFPVAAAAMREALAADLEDLSGDLDRARRMLDAVDEDRRET